MRRPAALVVQEIARVDVGTSTAVAVQNGLGSSPIRQHGSEDQKRDFLPDVATGRRFAENPLDFFDETHLQHLVRFIEDDHPDLVELERAAVEVIDEPSGRADDDLRIAGNVVWNGPRDHPLGTGEGFMGMYEMRVAWPSVEP